MAFKDITAYLKAFIPSSMRRMVHSVSGGLSFMSLLPRTDYDYASDIGDGTRSSTLMGPIQWIQRTFPEAPLCICQHDNDTRMMKHKMISLINNPNEFYDGIQLWMGTILSWCMDGNAYWVKIRNQLGDVVQLWYVPHWMMQPAQPTAENQTVFINHYEYRPIGTQKFDLPVKDVVHFRHGIDPSDPQRGISPFRSVFRDVWADDEASNWVAALLKNSGLPGMIVSPDPSGSNMNVLPMDVDAVKQYVTDMFTGDNRGRPLVLGGPTKIQEFGYDPKKMDLSASRNTAEERACAALGIPAAVVGFGTGLEATKVGATMREYSKLAWSNGIIPLQRTLAAVLDKHMMPEFGLDPETYCVKFDYSKIMALQDNVNDIFTRADKGVRGGWLSVADAKMMVGILPDPEDDVYLRPKSMIAVPVGMDALDIPVELQPPTPNTRPALPPPDEPPEDEEMAEADDEYLIKAGVQIQSFIFPKNHWRSAEQCVGWLRKHSYKTGLVETSVSWRARQLDPTLFERMRTICVAPTRGTAMNRCRIKAVVGPRKAAVMEIQPNGNGAIKYQ